LVRIFDLCGRMFFLNIILIISFSLHSNFFFLFLLF
jgi:hypothetical protein